ncbi:MAG: xanthine dehydrogenase family protein molybdopterin-binding subunit [Mizugakiibacter sp.]|uniref:xanthine dehydrogenase family protein molybdopterin-binding subunit n=1 Tax=Mizugakiibacter sp. TaxID=1972610 RepID=UPI0031CA0944|nr:xanthine dehydrogenase family protein molybdopterin-binding subunit [Xanthomonadaceae bacterium]
MNARSDPTRFDASRRDFLRASATLGAGLVIAFVVPGAMRRAWAQQGAGAAKPLPAPNAFLHVGTDDAVTVQLAHSEMGQGIWTVLPMLVAEELGCDWTRIRAQHAPAAPVYAHTVFGLQMTGGSTTTWSEFDRYRQVGALARTLLVQAAAQRWGVKLSACTVENGVVRAGTRSARFGELAEAAAKLPTPSTVALKPRKDWKLLGKATRRIDTPEKITGRARFGIDALPEGVLVALVARSPTFGGTVKSYDDKAARAVPGVRDVVQVPSGIAVLGDHFWAAKQGRDALKIEWDAGKNGDIDSDALMAHYRELAQQPGTPVTAAGDAAGALATATQRVVAQYELPYLAHATMEPMNCTVRLADDRCDIWVGTQAQGLDQPNAARAAGLAPEQVFIHTLFLGGGFGRRANPHSDFVVEAVHVAKAAKQPVKVVWTREDDMRGGWYRPMFLHRFEAALDAEGTPTAWRNVIVGQSILAGTPFAASVKNGVDNASVEGAGDSPYLKAIASHAVELHSPEVGVPVQWWRSVGHTHTAFAVESFVDELAHAAGWDPLAYRRKLLADAGATRRLGVLNKAAAAFGWDRPLPEGRGKGIAVHESFGSFVAQAVEASVVDGKPRVHRVVCAVDCGTALNPETVRAQMEGGIVFGLSAALYGAIALKDGKVQQGNFDTYPVLRIDAMPKIEVHIVDSGEKLGGIGEPGTPPIAPALCNALFAATGKRVRALPIDLAKAEAPAPLTPPAPAASAGAA